VQAWASAIDSIPVTTGTSSTTNQRVRSTTPLSAEVRSRTVGGTEEAADVHEATVLGDLDPPATMILAIRAPSDPPSRSGTLQRDRSPDRVKSDTVDVVEAILESSSAMADPEGFTYSQRKNGDVVIKHHAHVATVLRGHRAAAFLEDAMSADDQELMARLTGNYKHGNERDAAKHPRNNP
jgi:hypothetical protein